MIIMKSNAIIWTTTILTVIATTTTAIVFAYVTISKVIWTTLL